MFDGLVFAFVRYPQSLVGRDGASASDDLTYIIFFFHQSRMLGKGTELLALRSRSLRARAQ